MLNNKSNSQLTLQGFAQTLTEWKYDILVLYFCSPREFF